jgi:Flp pilus assembly protein TadG
MVLSLALEGEMARRMSVDGERGQDLVETALILPVFLLLAVGVIEFGLMIFAYNSVASAAREGARFGVIVTHTAEQVDDYVTDERALGLNNCANFGEVDFATASLLESNTVVQVEVLCNWRLFAGNFIEAVGGTDTIPLRAISSMRRE